MGPTDLGQASPTRPRTPTSRPRRLDWTTARRRRFTHNAMDASEVRRSVAARPPSRLLTRTSARSEPVALTAPVWWQRQDFWDVGLMPDTCRSGDGPAAEPDKRFGAAARLQPRREAFAAAVRSVKLSTS